MATKKRNAIRKAVPVLGAATVAGLVAMMGPAMAKPVSKNVLDAISDYYFNNTPYYGYLGKGVGFARQHHHHRHHRG